MIQRSASLSDWLGGGSEGWGEGIKKGWAGGVGRHIHTVAPTWAQLQQVPTTFVHERWCIGQESNVHTPVGICSGAAYPLRPNPRLQNEPHYLWKKKGEPGGGNSQTAPLFTQTFHTAKKEEKRKLCTGRKKIPIVCTILAYTLFTSLLQIKSTKKKKKKEKVKSLNTSIGQFPQGKQNKKVVQDIL